MLRKTREFGYPRPSKQKGLPREPLLLGGEGEIRTRGELPHACFQDKYLKPLGHLSVLLLILSELMNFLKDNPRLKYKRGNRIGLSIS